MRRGIASLIMGLSLVVASASWAGFILSHTVLDPGRSETLADTLLDNEAVRAVIVDRLADAVEAQIPASVPVTRDTIELGAEIALEDPRIEAVVRDGIVRSHQNALAGIDEPVTLDASALGEVGREAVVDLRPELDEALPPAPTLAVELPGNGLSWLGGVKNAVDRFTQVSAALALIGITAAFVLARNRAGALRRVAFWAFGASAFWVAVAYGVPKVLEQIAPSSVSIATAIIDVFLGAMVRPALIMAGVGVALLLLSFIWPAIARRRPAAMLDRPAPARGALDQGRPVLEGLSRSARPARPSPVAPVGSPPVDGYPPTTTLPVVEGPLLGSSDSPSRYHPDDIGTTFATDVRHWPEPEPPTTAWPEPDGPTATRSEPDVPTKNAWPEPDAPAATRWSEPGGVGRRATDTGRPEAESRLLPMSIPGDETDEPRWVEGVGYVDPEPSDDGRP